MKVVIVEPLGVPKPWLEEQLVAALPPEVDVAAYDTRPGSEAELAARARDADILVVANLPLRRVVLEQCGRLRFISVAFVGVDHVDMAYCGERGIIVSNCPGYSNTSVAELVILLTLALYRNLRVGDAAVRTAGHWNAIGPGREIAGKVFGVLGLGAIGRYTAELMRALGATVIAYNRTPREIPGIEFLPLTDVMQRADIVSVHVRYTPQTRHFVSADLIDSMKRDAVLINTARGQVVDGAALARALKEGRIAGAGLDVFETEPLPADDPLLSAPNTVFTPHIGFTSREALARRACQVLENVRAFLEGAPVSVI